MLVDLLRDCFASAIWVSACLLSLRRVEYSLAAASRNEQQNGKYHILVLVYDNMKYIALATWHKGRSHLREFFELLISFCDSSFW